MSTCGLSRCALRAPSCRVTYSLSWASSIEGVLSISKARGSTAASSSFFVCTWRLAPARGSPTSGLALVLRLGFGELLGDLLLGEQAGPLGEQRPERLPRGEAGLDGRAAGEAQ